MAWRLAGALVVLRNEIQQVAPGTTVWTIGDEAHQQRDSDHNPNAAGVVCAVDVVDDAGLDLAHLAETVRTGGHPAGKYVIYRDRIASAARGWRWRSYGGTFHSHVHVSVGVGPDGASTGPYDDTSPWGLAEEDEMYTERQMQAFPWQYAGGGMPGVPSRHSTLWVLGSIYSAVVGEDVAAASAAAARQAVREEFAVLGPALAEQLGDSEERVTAALRAVLGSLDEVQPG